MTEHPLPHPTCVPVALGSPRDWLLLGGSVWLLAPKRGRTGAALARVIPTASQRRVLRCRVRPGDQRIPLRAVSRLFAGVPDQVLDGLTPSARDALANLEEGRLPAVPVPVLLVQCAVLSLVRLLATQAPLLLVIDGVQWLDPQSAQVLRFLATHVRGLPALVQVVAIEQRRSTTPPAGQHLCPPPLLRVRLGRPANRPANRRAGLAGRTRLARPVQSVQPVVSVQAVVSARPVVAS